ncbi:hypothetical protein BDV93DRAFT_557448 [Ceratobasidium sp. AG-I]|nr:hypothetical protein BDV93DRAFT_557448 [Ceratobasidium sp. AG-I]
MLCLPSELCALIVAQVGIKDLAQLAQTSHAMLDRFVPYLWEDVNAAWLLTLPQGSSFYDTKPNYLYSKGRIPIPVPIPTDYFARFVFYARHVKSISMRTRWYHLKGDPSRHKLAWPSVLSYSSAHVLFPKLTKLHLEIFDESIRTPWDWATLFIAPTLTEIHYNVPCRAGRESSRTLDSIMSKCLGLERIKLSNFGDVWLWDGVASSPISQSLRSLKVRHGAMGSSFLSWAGQMPELEELDLQPYEWGNYNQSSLPNLDLPPESFPSLRFLKFTGGDAILLAQLCRTGVVTHLTKLVVELYNAQDGIATDQLFALVAAHSPGLQEFECYGVYQLVNLDIVSLYPLSLRSLKLSVSYEAGPELYISTLSGLSPTLEALELNSNMSFGTLMLLPLRLLRLEVLRVCIDLHAIPDVDTSHLAGASFEQIRVLWLSHPFTLTIRSSQREEPEPAKLEVCAKILAMTWPGMNLYFGDPEYGLEPVPYAALIKRKVADYSELILQNEQDSCYRNIWGGEPVFDALMERFM